VRALRLSFWSCLGDHRRAAIGHAVALAALA
jgi:hypothetical protein